MNGAILRTIPLVLRNVGRRPLRTAVTVTGIATAIFLFTFIESMRGGVRDAVSAGASETRLVVYRQNRFCPFTSQLPQTYVDRISRINGVTSAVPMKIIVTNCRASLDVVTFRGVPMDALDGDMLAADATIAGSVAEWRSRGDAALIGQALADRRGLRVGDPLVAAGVTAYVAGILSSDDPQDRNAAYVQLPFLQQSAQKGGAGGIVTQFVVTVDDPAHLEQVAHDIDAEFANDPFPTATRSETAFVARAAHDVLVLVSFASWIGWASLAAVFALIANAIALSVRDRVRDHAIMQTLGFSGGLIAWLVIAEATMLGVLGGTIGAGLAWAAVAVSKLNFTMEGVSIEVVARPMLAAMGLGLALLLGLLAGIVPAWSASRREIAASFRVI